MVILKCKRCGYEWDYKGKSEWYASCSRCKTSINIKKQLKSKNNKKNKDIICSICGNKKSKYQMANEDICLECSNNIIEGMNLFETDNDNDINK